MVLISDEARFARSITARWLSGSKDSIKNEKCIKSWSAKRTLPALSVQ